MKIVKYIRKYSDLVKEFECGNMIIDNFLKYGCALDENQGITYLMLSDDFDFIIGYYNIETGRIDRVETVAGKDYYKPMGGTVNINYLAIHSKYQGKKIVEMKERKIYLGDILLRDCEKRILSIRKNVGIAFVTLCSTEQGYNLYHERNGYEDFDDDMNNFVSDSDGLCIKLYKYVDEIVD